MKIAIVGATGTAGRATAVAAQAAGHEVIALSRATGVDLHTGAGLTEGLLGAEVVIDTSNPFPTATNQNLVDTFRATTAQLVQACQQTGIPHLVHLSICNIDSPAFDTFDYYLAKRAQEEVLGRSNLKHSVVRSTQWMEFALNPSAVTQKQSEVCVEDWLIQPIAVATVADVLIEAVTADPHNRQIAGPEQVRLPNLTRMFLEAQGDTRPVTAMPPTLPAFATGALLAPPEAELLGPSVTQWVSASQSEN